MYYSKLAETFIKQFGDNKIIYKDQVEDEKVNLTLLWHLSVKVVIGFIQPHDALRLNCSMYKEGLTWPNYVWILVDIEVSDLQQTFGCNEIACTDPSSPFIYQQRHSLTLEEHL